MNGKTRMRLIAGGIGLAIGGVVAAVMLFGPQNGSAGNHAGDQHDMTPPKMTAEEKTAVAEIPVKAERIDDKGWVRGDMMLGNPDAPVTIVEYASLSCPHCAAFHAATFPALKRDYIATGKVKFIYRHMPTDGFALRAGMIAQCAGEQRFFPLIDLLFRNINVWRTSNDPLTGLKNQVRQAGVGTAKVDECLADTALRDEIVKAAYEGQSQFGVSATPSFVVNGELIENLHNLEDFRRVLDPLVN